MIVYLDASAFVPLVVAEATSASCRRIWGDADSVVGTRLLYVESMAALSRAVRGRRVPNESVHAALRQLEALWHQMRVIEIDADLAGRAGTAAWRFGLRGYDLVHCAAGALLSGDESPESANEPNRVVAASADHDLLTAWRKLGLAPSSLNLVPRVGELQPEDAGRGGGPAARELSAGDVEVPHNRADQKSGPLLR